MDQDYTVLVEPGIQIFMFIISAAAAGLSSMLYRRWGIQVSEHKRMIILNVIDRGIRSALLRQLPRDQIVSEVMTYIEETSPDAYKDATRKGINGLIRSIDHAVDRVKDSMEIGF